MEVSLELSDNSTANDYYPFGMIMPGRKYSAANGYRYGFNGKENDKDAGEGIQDYGMRIYDERVSRFLSVDPISKNYAFYSPYIFAGCNPILAIDLDGLEPAQINPGTKTLIIFINGFTENPKKGQTQTIEDMDGLGIASAALKSLTATQVLTFASHRGETTKNDVIQTIKNLKKTTPDGKVILIGHSQGGDNIVELAKENRDIALDLVILVDANDGSNAFIMNVPDDNIYGNVKNIINYHQKTESLLTGVTIGKDDIKDSKKTKFADVLVKGSIHTSIDGDVAPYIIDDVIQFNAGGDPTEHAKKRQLPTFTPKENDKTSSQIVKKKYLSGSNSSKSKSKS